MISAEQVYTQTAKQTAKITREKLRRMHASTKWGVNGSSLSPEQTGHYAPTHVVRATLAASANKQQLITVTQTAKA